MFLLKKIGKLSARRIKIVSIFSPYSNSATENDTYFGYQSVNKDEKAKKVHGVFENVASNYDLMNDVMSGGIHRLWKDYFVSCLKPTAGIKMLDVAGGTGDITFRVLKYINSEVKEENEHNFISQDLGILNYESSNLTDNTLNKQEELQTKVTVCDISENMLAVGRERAAAHGFSNIEWICGDAQSLPFPDESFDVYTIAYGMRNVVDINKALREAYRVLRVGGRFLCLEFSNVKNPLIQRLYDLYSFQVIPVMGQVIAADWDSYQYLVESIRKFPNQESFKSMIEDVGFRRTSYRNLTFGVTAIHSGFKI